MDQTSRRPTRPNVLVVMPDSLRADAVGAFGSPVARTPNIDALAARGTRFTQAFSQNPVCSPSRVSMLTGWYPHVHGHRTLGNLIKPTYPNMLRSFKEAGYNVAWIGRMADTLAPGLAARDTDFHGLTVRPRTRRSEPPFGLDHKHAWSFYYGRTESEGPFVDLDEAAVRTAEAWLADAPREPWLCYVTLADPHPPFQVEDPWFSMHDRRDMPAPLPADHDGKPRFMKLIHERYGLGRLDAGDWAEIAATYHGMVSRTDDHLGRLVEAVEGRGAASSTVVVFHTDHGEYLGDFGLVEKWPSGLDECLLRNPLVIAHPDMPGGRSCDSLVEMVDLLPTMLEMCGISAGHTHFGRSLVPLLRDPSLPHRDAVFSQGGHRDDEPHVLEGPMPRPYQHKTALQREDASSVGKAVAMRTSRWTYVRRLYEPDELYDRGADPRETRNLIGTPSGAAVAARCRERMLDWLVATADVVPWIPDPRIDPAVAERLRSLPREDR